MVLYGVFAGLPLLVAVYCLTVQPADLFAVGLTFLIVAFGTGVPLVRLLVERRRSRSLVHDVRSSETGADLAPDAHPVRIGLNESGGPHEPSPWDITPPRDGVLAVTPDHLQLRGEDGASVDLPLTDILGVVLVPGGRGRAGADIHLRTGEAIEVRTTRLRALAVCLSHAGVRVLQEEPVV